MLFYKYIIIKTLFLAILVLGITTRCLGQESSKKNIAEVSQMQGVYVFVMSKPLREYDYLGTTKIKVAWTGQPEEMLNISLKKLKKDYPLADGIIFTTLNMDQADVIKFKSSDN